MYFQVKKYFKKQLPLYFKKRKKEKKMSGGERQG
jgi:hypothetical protein